MVGGSTSGDLGALGVNHKNRVGEYQNIIKAVITNYSDLFITKPTHYRSHHTSALHRPSVQNAILRPAQH